MHVLCLTNNQIQTEHTTTQPKQNVFNVFIRHTQTNLRNQKQNKIKKRMISIRQKSKEKKRLPNTSQTIKTPSPHSIVSIC